MSKSTIDDIEHEVEAVAKSFNVPPEGRNGFQEVEAITTKEEIEERFNSVETIAELSTLIDTLHATADARIGVKRYITTEKSVGILGHDAKEDVLIRDATGQKPYQDIQKFEQTPESYMISVIGSARGAMKLIAAAEFLDPEKKEDLKNSVMNEMKDRLHSMNTGLKVEKPTQNMSEVRDFENYLISQITENKIVIGGKPLKDKAAAVKALSDSRDLANIYDKQPHLATIWNAVKGEKITTIAARISPISDEQKIELDNISKHGQVYKKPKYSFIDRLLRRPKPIEEETAKKLPKWYKELNPQQQQLVINNAEALKKGDKTIATALRFMPGLRNSYLEVDMRTDVNGRTSKFNSVLRTATISYFKGKSKESQLDVSTKNVEHLAKLSGSKKPTLQIYNYNAFDEKPICQLAEKATKIAKVNYSQVGMQASFSKEKMIDRVLDGQNVKDDGIVVVSCKSGKDRTDFGSRIKKMFKLTEALGLGEDKAAKAAMAESCAMAAHGETIAGGYGGNQGSKGLKHKGFFNFMNILDVSKSFGKHQWFASDKVKELSSNKPAALNNVKPKKLTKKDKEHTKIPETIKIKPKLQQQAQTQQCSVEAEKIRNAAMETAKGSVSSPSSTKAKKESITR